MFDVSSIREKCFYRLVKEDFLFDVQFTSEGSCSVTAMSRVSVRAASVEPLLVAGTLRWAI